MADPASVRGHLPLLGRPTLILLLTCHVAGGCASVSKSPAATPAPVSSEQESAPPPGAPEDAAQEFRKHKSYVIPAIEIIGMDAAINLAGRRLVDPAAFPALSPARDCDQISPVTP